MVGAGISIKIENLEGKLGLRLEGRVRGAK